jgi:hypothetical protein
MLGSQKRRKKGYYMTTTKQQALTSVPLYYASFPLKPHVFYVQVVLNTYRKGA